VKKTASALILTGYGLNCDYETDYALKKVGAVTRKAHINELVKGNLSLHEFQILVFIGGFAWADDHGAGVVLATRLRNNIGIDLDKFIDDGKLMISICNGFQTMVNLGILPGFDGNYSNRLSALIDNDCGNFTDQWITLQVNDKSPCIFTRGIDTIDLPVRHAEGKFFAEEPVLTRLEQQNQVVMKYSKPDGNPAHGQTPYNPNGSLMDIAGICDPTGRIFGLMPHPEAFNHLTNHPQWVRKKDLMHRQNNHQIEMEGDGLRIFENAVRFIENESL